MKVFELLAELTKLVESGHGELDVVLVGSEWIEGNIGHESVDAVSVEVSKPLYDSDRLTASVVRIGS